MQNALGQPNLDPKRLEILSYYSNQRWYLQVIAEIDLVSRYRHFSPFSQKKILKQFETLQH